MGEREGKRKRVNEKTIWSVVSYVSSMWESLSRLKQRGDHGVLGGLWTY